jgi:hypothetical protein
MCALQPNRRKKGEGATLVYLLSGPDYKWKSGGRLLINKDRLTKQDMQFFGAIIRIDAKKENLSYFY